MALAPEGMAVPGVPLPGKLKVEGRELHSAAALIARAASPLHAACS